ncbi:MAG: MFS transporter [Chloroflexota bacterium]
MPASAAAAAPDALSYRALLRVPQLGRVILSMQLSRIGATALGVGLTLFTLVRYDAPELAGIVSFASIVPGLFLSPIAGALLDRHGRVRLVALDQCVAAIALALVALLSLAGALTPAVLVAIAAAASLTGPLGGTGVRSLFPLMVPPALWGRANAVDSNGYLAATVVGPPLAAGAIALAGPEGALLVHALPFLLAAASLRGVREPRTEDASTGDLVRDAWLGLRYVLGNPTLRGLAAGIGSLNACVGILSIVIPLLVLRRLDGGEALVGIAFAVAGVTGIVSGFAFGRIDTQRRGWLILWVGPLCIAPAVALLLVTAGVEQTVGIACVFVAMAWYGLVAGPHDVTMFTMRQTRTDRAWFGRAFAISMAMNYVGTPIGAALAGFLAERSLDTAILAGVVACGVSALALALLVPRTARAAPGTRPARGAGVGS